LLASRQIFFWPQQVVPHGCVPLAQQCERPASAQYWLEEQHALPHFCEPSGQVFFGTHAAEPPGAGVHRQSQSSPGAGQQAS
jgi:hypothetical protein